MAVQGLTPARMSKHGYHIPTGSAHLWTLHYHLGAATEHSIYEAEIVGSILGTELLHTEHTLMAKPSVVLDNKSSIEATQQLRPHPSYYLTDYLLNRACMVHDQVPGSATCYASVVAAATLTLHWVSRHTGIQSNEIADWEAKCAAKDAAKSSSSRHLPPLL